MRTVVPKNDNNFFWIRHFAALGVLLGHSYVLVDKVAPKVFGEQIHKVALEVFFIISGYLVCKSWERDQSLLRYFIKRSVRIFPGLILVVLITVFIIGPITTKLPLREYFAGADFKIYFWNIGLAPYFHLPGVFSDLAPNDGVNGSLWSLPVEFALYFLIPLFSCSDHPRIVRLANFALVGGLFMTSLFYQTLGATYVNPVIYWTSLPYALQIAAFFACASWYQSFKLDRFLNLQVALAMSVLMQLCSRESILNQLLMLLCLPYIILTFGLARDAVFASNERWGDASYGIYLYAFPVQQCIIEWFGKDLSPILITVATLPLTFGLALFSWHAVEKHALRWKPRLSVTRPLGEPGKTSKQVSRAP